jgi:hypothetical protein
MSISLMSAVWKLDLQSGLKYTLLALAEPQIKTLLNIPEHIATAAVVMLGWPAKPFPKSLKRKPLTEAAYLDAYGAPLPGAEQYV